MRGVCHPNAIVGGSVCADTHSGTHSVSLCFDTLHLRSKPLPSPCLPYCLQAPPACSVCILMSSSLSALSPLPVCFFLSFSLSSPSLFFFLAHSLTLILLHVTLVAFLSLIHTHAHTCTRTHSHTHSDGYIYWRSRSSC